MKKTDYNWLVSELPTLVQANIIDEATQDKIHQYYTAKLRRSNQSARRALFAITGSALLICIGVIFISLSWPHIPTFLKLLTAFLPIIISGIVQTKWPSLWSALAWCISIAIGLALSKSAFHLDSSIASFYWQWALLSTPIVLLTKHPISHTAGLVAMAMGTAITSPISHVSDIMYWPLLIALLYQTKPLLTGIANEREKNTLAWCAPLSIALCIVTTHSSLGTIFWPITATVALSALYTYAMGNAKLHWRLATPSKWVGRLGLLGLGIIASHSAFWDHINTQFHQLPQGALSLTALPNAFYLLSTLVLSGILIWHLSRIATINAWRLSPLLVLALSIIIASTLALSAPAWATLIAGVTLITTLIVQIGISIKTKNIGSFNMANITLIFLSTTHFLTSDIPVSVKGSIIICSMAALFLINGWKHRIWRPNFA